MCFARLVSRHDKPQVSSMFAVASAVSSLPQYYVYADLQEQFLLY